MRLEILNPDQVVLLHYLGRFNRSFYMVGGTAIALHIGHRRSIDFDLFTPSKLNRSRLMTTLKQIPYTQFPIFEDYDQLHLMINNVKVTFFNYPYPIDHPVSVNKHITIPSLLTLAAMKAFALGRRAKWKDYVDLYYILKYHYSIEEIINEAMKIFSQQFSGKLFRQQLAFHQDIDYTEKVEFLCSEPSENEIKEFLIEKAIDIFHAK